MKPSAIWAIPTVQNIFVSSSYFNALDKKKKLTIFQAIFAFSPQHNWKTGFWKLKNI